MEKLILPCGRFIPRFAGDAETRLLSMEAYLARLSEELEILLEETAKALDALQSVQNSLVEAWNRQEGGA